MVHPVGNPEDWFSRVTAHIEADVIDPENFAQDLSVLACP